MQFPTSSKVACMAAIMTLAACSKSDQVATPDQTPKPEVTAAGKYISQIFEYAPAPGQFINAGNTGTPAGAQKLIGGTSALVSLGAYGGYITFGFDHPVQNNAGADIGIYGNPLINTNQEWSEPGIVMVMQDLNNNGKPDDGEWYELAGSEYNNPATIRNYKITYYNPKQSVAADVLWKDNQGRSGYVLKNNFHGQSYYPSFAANQDSLVFTGALLPNTLVKRFDPVINSNIITNQPLAAGYSDNGSAEFINFFNTTGRGYNTVDISNAVNSQGQKVNLSYINFVKIYTGQNNNGNTSADPANPDRKTGEVSTEVSGAMDLGL
ncbi:MAG TPA: hypothetical protein VM802_04425 [Chitinophaga sp.]|uniref:hypothetical protein n=1 Tax=Chitinophaga sp. TaxID=1869181 RepID=UPI002BAC6291|nr:hypothetical protein [Chitinophaga sp.]HVI44084.1 hypothetical protein [Chitinophaga sp.]